MVERDLLDQKAGTIPDDVLNLYVRELWSAYGETMAINDDAVYFYVDGWRMLCTTDAGAAARRHRGWRAECARLRAVADAAAQARGEYRCDECETWTSAWSYGRAQNRGGSWCCDGCYVVYGFADEDARAAQRAERRAELARIVQQRDEHYDSDADFCGLYLCDCCVRRTVYWSHGPVDGLWCCDDCWAEREESQPKSAAPAHESGCDCDACCWPSDGDAQYVSFTSMEHDPYYSSIPLYHQGVMDQIEAETGERPGSLVNPWRGLSSANLNRVIGADPRWSRVSYRRDSPDRGA